MTALRLMVKLAEPGFDSATKLEMIEARRLQSWQSLALIQLPSSSMIADLSQSKAAGHRQMSPRAAQQLELGSLSHIHGDSWGPHGDPWGVEGQWRPMGTAWGPREDPAGTHGDPMWTHGDPWGPYYKDCCCKRRSYNTRKCEFA